MYKNEYDMDTLLNDLRIFFGKRFSNLAEDESTTSLFFEYCLFYGVIVLVVITIVHAGLNGMWIFYFTYFIIWLLATQWENKLRNQKNNQQKCHKEIDEDEIEDCCKYDMTEND